MATPTTLPASFTSGQVLTAAQMNNLRGAFRVLQVVSTTKTNTFSTTSSTFTDVTGLTAAITPSATSSKILIVASLAYSVGSGTNDSAMARISGGNATAYVGDAASNRIRAAHFINNSFGPAAFNTPTASLVYLDSPATTSAITYAVQVRIGATGTVYVNQSQVDSDNAQYARLASTITVMEISA